VWQRLFEALAAGCGQRIRHDRLDHRARAPAQQRRQRGGLGTSHRAQPRGLEHQDPRHGGCTGQSHGLHAHAGGRPRI
jgi:hypothetical protein